MVYSVLAEDSSVGLRQGKVSENGFFFHGLCESCCRAGLGAHVLVDSRVARGMYGAVEVAWGRDRG